MLLLDKKTHFVCSAVLCHLKSQLLLCPFGHSPASTCSFSLCVPSQTFTLLAFIKAGMEGGVRKATRGYWVTREGTVSFNIQLLKRQRKYRKIKTKTKLKNIL